MNAPGATRADRLRTIALERVAEEFGYRRDRGDRARWKRRGSAISINGTSFYDHIQCRGGGGAIDLAMHAAGCPFREALDLLERIAPGPEPGHWPLVQRYLTEQRSLDPALIDHCHRNGLLDADRRANAVFITRSADAAATGAELHGTRPGRPFKGMTPGSRKSEGGFWIARKRTGPVLLVESAIDALSALSLPELCHVRCVISTAGVAIRLPKWIKHLIPETLLCGYDADEAGDIAARRLIENHPGIQRLRPEAAKDWNAKLQAIRDANRDKHDDGTGQRRKASTVCLK